MAWLLRDWACIPAATEPTGTVGLLLAVSSGVVRTRRPTLGAEGWALIGGGFNWIGSGEAKPGTAACAKLFVLRYSLTIIAEVASQPTLF